MLARAFLFLLDSLAGLLSLILLLRFFMQTFRVSFVNPLGVFVNAATHWLVRPLRRVVPSVFGLDSASLLAAYLVQMLPLLAVLLFAALGSAYGDVLATPYTPIVFLLGQALRSTLRLCAHLLIAVLILRIIFSWFEVPSRIALPVSQLTRPLLAPIRRFLPPIGGIDLSPLVIILALEMIILFV